MKRRQGVTVRELQTDLSAAIANRQAAQAAHASWATCWFSVSFTQFYSIAFSVKYNSKYPKTSWNFLFFLLVNWNKWKYKSYCSTVHFRRITSIYQPTNAHIISHKTPLKHFKTLRNVSILSDHHQGALFLAKVIFTIQFVFANEVLWQHIMFYVKLYVHSLVDKLKWNKWNL